MTLTVALAMVAGLVLLAVVVHGAWTARRGTPRLPQQATGSDHAPRMEPTLTPQADPALMESADARALPTVSLRRQAKVDALIDAIATITPESPVTGELALQHFPGSRRAGTKPFHVEGLNAETSEWEMPRSGQRYGEFQAGLQMANRHGPVNEIEYSEFVQKVGAFAEALSAATDFPDMLDAVARARELDTFASQHDAQLTAILRANTIAWSVGYVQQAAGRHGFVPGSVPGRLVLPAQEDGAPAILTLVFDAQVALADDPGHAALRELSLSLDVPQTLESAEPFAAWQHCARRLADDLDATLVDDQGNPITLHAFAAIGLELDRLYRALESRDLSAGSPAARRLFS
ncbi:cell division protein ZipA C-terminal FtsZ-binding domain-containing protein [Ideonella sp. DXS29W]|uniref:Cell division protein ZipA n=1 Tax=Ideonella lacteola TaxID=2984193 RepID=A0ABU9BRQ8_9BURK